MGLEVRMRDRTGASLLLACCWIILSCSGGNSSDSDVPRANSPDALVIYVVNYPLEYFAERIGGEWVEVHFPAPPDVDPATWIPDPETIIAYQSADLVLLNGGGFASWVNVATLLPSRVVETARELSDPILMIPDALTHSHGLAGKHAHAGFLSTVWLDPILAIDQTRTIERALAERLPEHAGAFRENRDLLERDLLDLNRQWIELVAGKEAQPLIAQRPDYKYIARRYGLNLESVSWDDREAPDEGLWEELAVGLEVHPAKWFLCPKPPSEPMARRLGQMGLKTVVVDIGANRPLSGNYLDLMRRNIVRLRAAYE
jgi:zinc transport system substrate-binding protein